MQFQSIRYGDLSVTDQFMHKIKALSNEMTRASRPLSLKDFNIESSFHDLVLTLVAIRPNHGGGRGSK